MRRKQKAASDRGGSRQPAKIAQVDLDLGALGEPLVISDLSRVPGRNDRLRVAINGAPVGSLTLDFVADQGVREGRVVDRNGADRIVVAVGRTAVLDKALDLLAVRARSSRDLRIRLRRAGALEDGISWAIDRLVAQGFVDDAEYARQVARSKVLSGGVSRRKVVSALRQRGIAADVATTAIEATLAEVELDEHGAALAAAQKRLRALASLDPATRRQRLYAFLARRGYESDVVRRVLKEVLEA
jgi:regulatory protein